REARQGEIGLRFEPDSSARGEGEAHPLLADRPVPDGGDEAARGAGRAGRLEPLPEFPERRIGARPRAADHRTGASGGATAAPPSCWSIWVRTSPRSRSAGSAPLSL